MTFVIFTWCPWSVRPKSWLPTAVQVTWSSRSGLTNWWVEQDKADMTDRDDVGLFVVFVVACPVHL